MVRSEKDAPRRFGHSLEDFGRSLEGVDAPWKIWTLFEGAKWTLLPFDALKLKKMEAKFRFFYSYGSKSIAKCKREDT